MAKHYYIDPSNLDLIVIENADTLEGHVDKPVIRIPFAWVEGRDERKKDKERKKRNQGKKSKITPEIIQEIKKMKKDGKSAREISEELGISMGTVWKYLKK